MDWGLESDLLQNDTCSPQRSSNFERYLCDDTPTFFNLAGDIDPPPESDFSFHGWDFGSFDSNTEGCSRPGDTTTEGLHQGITPKEKIWTCSDCLPTKRFKTSKDVEEHAKSKGHYPYKCTVVGCQTPAFQRRDTFARHMKTHRDPAYECLTCGQKFARLDVLRNHTLRCRVHAPDNQSTHTIFLRALRSLLSNPPAQADVLHDVMHNLGHAVVVINKQIRISDGPRQAMVT